MPRVLRYFIITGALAIVLLAIGAVVGYRMLQTFLRSDEFRTKVSQGVSSGLKMDGQFTPFSWQDFSVYSDGYSARGDASAPMSSLRMEQVRALFRPRSFIVGPWTVERIDVGNLDVSFNSPAISDAPPAPDVASPTIPAPAPASPDEKPRKIKIEHVAISSATFHWPGPGELKGVQLDCEPESDDGNWRIDCVGGHVTNPGLPEFLFIDGKLRLKPDRLFIVVANLQTAPHGEIQISGEAVFQPNPSLDLETNFKGIDLAKILPPDWRAKLFGGLNGRAHIRGIPGQMATFQAKGQASVSDGRLEAIPALDQIATLTKTREFRTLRLQKIVGDFDVSANRTTITNMIIYSEGLLRAEGQVTISEGKNLTGSFQLGLAAATVKAIPGADTQVFTEARDGMLWTKVQLGGTLDSPSEDLSPRLRDAFLKQLPKQAEDAVRGLIDKARDFIPLPFP